MAYRHILIIWVVSILVLVGVGVRPALANVPVEQFTLARQGVFTEMAIQVPGRLLCNHFIEEPKFGKPFRVVLDLCGAIHQLGQKDFETVPPGVISRVRTSQYATSPQNVVRLVLDLTREVSYKVSIDEQTIKISLVTPHEPDFALWSSIPEKSGPVLTSRPAPSERTESPAASAVADLVAQTSERKSATAPKVEKHKPPAVKPVEQTQSPMSTFESPPIASTQSAKEKTDREVVLEESEEQTAERVFVQMNKRLDESPDPEVQQKPVRLPVIQYDLPAGPEWTEKPVLVSTKQDAATAPLVQKSQPVAVTTQPEEPVSVIDSALVVTQGDFEKISPMVVAQEEEKLPLLARLKQRFFGSAAEEQAAPDAVTDSAALARIRALAKMSEETVAQDEGGVESSTPSTPRSIDPAELESKIAGVIRSTAEPGSAIAASETEPGMEQTTEKFAGKGEPVSVEPSRKEVKYDRAGRRDPFDALIEGQRSGLWTTALPRVESLRLVGILEDYDGAIALFEDMEGYGYILQEGDPVKNGYVKVVGEDRVLFQVDDYGWVHTVALELRQDASRLNYDYAEESEDE